MNRFFGHVCLFAAAALAFACAAPPGGEGDSTVGAGTDTGGLIEGETSTSSGGDTGTSSGGIDDAGTTEDDATDAGAGDDGAVTEGDAGTGDDAAAEDTAVEGCPGADNCDCTKNSECDGGICIDTAVGKKCAQTCVDKCPDGFTCNKYDPGGGDTVFICTPNHVSLCSPCNQDADCQIFGATSLCVDYNAEGKFCGSACTSDTDCPSDYACTDVDIGGGNKKKQCKLKDATKVCACNKWAINAGKGTACSTTNDKGTCKGTRSCGATGLSACDAPTAKAEECNGVDSDCNGKTDDIDSSAFDCVQKAWFDTGSKSKCVADADCSEAGESCAEDTKTCRTLIGACKGTSTCEKGKLKCINAKSPKLEQCNGDDDDCDGKVDEDYVWKNPKDASVVAVGGKCGLGVCAGGQVKCETLSNAVCDSEKAAKSDKDTCNGKDDDCDGEIDEAACDDGTDCTKDSCDPTSGKCTNTADVDCDDKNQCTKDACDDKTGKCTNTLLVGTCDDEDACTDGDKCEDDNGKAVCAPGATKKDCDDSNVCTDDSCDKDKGCVNLANAVTMVCYDATDKKTEGVGECKAGAKSCKDGQLGSKCVGEVRPALKEACDGKDDTCDGKTDEGCKTAGIDVTFATAHATVSGSKKNVTFELSGSSPAGSAKGTKKTVHLGFLRWISSLLGK